MDTAKFEAFLAIAHRLNEAGVTPLLAGSLGVELLTGTDWDPHDIDIWVPGDARGWDAPDEERIAQWPIIESLMASLGFDFIDLHEHAFVNDADICVEFGVIDTLPAFAGISVESLRPRCTRSTRYLLLTAQQYAALYRASAADAYRTADERAKDMLKVRCLEEMPAVR